jgi:predicted RNase H-like HicB family nuclease
MISNEKLRYSMLIQWSDEDQAYLVSLPEWTDNTLMPVTHGDSYEEAAKNGREVLEMLMKSKQEPPEPDVHVSEEEGMSEDEDESEKSCKKGIDCTVSSGNVFADLGLPDPEGHLRVAERFRMIDNNGDFATFYQGYEAGKEDAEECAKIAKEDDELWEKTLNSPESHAFLDKLEEEAMQEYREGRTKEGGFGSEGDEDHYEDTAEDIFDEIRVLTERAGQFMGFGVTTPANKAILREHAEKIKDASKRLDVAIEKQREISEEQWQQPGHGLKLTRRGENHARQ